MLQNSMSHTRHTVLKFIDIQHIAETHLVPESRSRLEQPLLGDDYAGGHQEREADASGDILLRSEHGITQ